MHTVSSSRDPKYLRDVSLSEAMICAFLLLRKSQDGDVHRVADSPHGHADAAQRWKQLSEDLSMVTWSSDVGQVPYQIR